jgi:beta-lactamase superfamily II metal-dependent hydrolase
LRSAAILRFFSLASLATLASACSIPSSGVSPGWSEREPASAVLGTPSPPAPAVRRMTVHFYDVGQGLAALVDLPAGGHVLVDTGDQPRRPGCGDPCAAADEHLIARLREDLGGAPIDLVWITHQHSDHIGGAEAVFDAVSVRAYVDNGRDGAHPEVRKARRAARDHGAVVGVIDPGHADLPLATRAVVTAATADVTMTPIVPDRWPSSCESDANDCSIALRIDFGASSVLFTGDAQHEEEARLDPHGAATLLQIGHHGSDTSTSPGFLSKVRPRYAVISAGAPGEGMNREYCHPRALVVQRLTRVLSGPSSSTLDAFDGDRCDRAVPGDWRPVPSSDALWATERDGDVVLTTTGDGTFQRLPAPARSASRLRVRRF